MVRLSTRIVVSGVFLCALAHAAPESVQIDRAFQNLYNFDFPAAHSVLNGYIAAHPQEPLPYAVRASAYLFFELDRLGILESEFLIDDKKISKKEKALQPDPGIRGQFMRALDDTESRAEAVLRTDPNDRSALLAMCIAQGVTTDYMAFIEKRQFRSLSPAEQSNIYAQRLLRLFVELNRSGTSIVIATHDIALMDQYDARRLVLHDGRIHVYD